MLQLEKELRAKTETLTKEKDDRLHEMKLLKDEDQRLCDCMYLTPFYIPTGVTPSHDQLKSLQQHVTDMKTEKVLKLMLP